MKLTPEQRRIARAILEHPDDGFVTLVSIAGLNPTTAFIGADLRDVMCSDDVTGFVFHNADLRGADFSRARGKTAAMFESTIVDLRTRGLPPSRPAASPPSFDVERVCEMVLRRQLVPADWMPFVTALDLSTAGIRQLRDSIGLLAREFVDVRRSDAIDLRSLAGLTALRDLDLGGTRVRDVSRLAALTSLKRLDLGFTLVSDLSPVASLAALQNLDVRATRVPDVSPLAGLTAVETLDLGYTRVSNVSPLACLTALQNLDLGGTHVSDVPPLAGLTALQHLDLTSTHVSDVSPLAGLTALQCLDPWGTWVSDVSPLTALELLKINGVPQAGGARRQGKLAYLRQAIAIDVSRPGDVARHGSEQSRSADRYAGIM